VCLGDTGLDRIPRDAVTIAVDGAASPAPASYALLTRTPAVVPSASVVLTVGPVRVDHPFVVPCLLARGAPGSRSPRNRLAVGSDASPAAIAVAMAAHLGATRVEMVGA
jgi:hypothetical protein